MRRIGRRTLLAWSLAAAGMGRPPELPALPPGDALAFRVMRYGSQIGTHTLAFERLPNGGLDVHIAVNVVVKFGPIPLVRYIHANIESWRERALAGLVSHTDRNGTELQMRAWRARPGLEVEGTDTPQYVAPANALPTTYWNSRMLWGPVIGTQRGTLVNPKVTELGVQSVLLASGKPIQARRYHLDGPGMNVDVLYDDNDVWAGLEFKVEDGSLITYERI